MNRRGKISGEDYERLRGIREDIDIHIELNGCLPPMGKYTEDNPLTCVVLANRKLTFKGPDYFGALRLFDLAKELA